VCSAPRRIRNCTRHICPPVVWPARVGQNPTQADHGSAIAAGVRPTHREILRRVLATIPAGSRRAAAACCRAPHVGPGLGEVAAGRSRGWRGSGAGGGGRRLTARNLRPYAYLNRRRRASLIRPAKRPVSRLAGSNEGFWDDCPLPWSIVRMAGAAARLSPPGRSRARVACAAGPWSSAGLLGAGTSPQPGLTVVQAG
jgi:hypothetical protein